eukprot:TRINITY_DN3214_c0_g1_i2.p2 TRINITY_DN3214_c0_g1~~TRINITY_DN3214_c0_g1_i2.p2  ORF type:complete len:117 (+),score=13.51 TRINITY_DN3214_c0_g1_i2:271-621(+)
MLIYDVTSRMTFNHLEDWIRDVKRVAPEDVKLLFVGNKSDLLEKREVSYKEAKDLALSHGAKLVETSAKSSSNIELAFEILTSEIHEQMKNSESFQRQRAERLSNTKEAQKQKSCC